MSSGDRGVRRANSHGGGRRGPALTGGGLHGARRRGGGLPEGKSSHARWAMMMNGVVVWECLHQSID